LPLKAEPKLKVTDLCHHSARNDSYKNEGLRRCNAVSSGEVTDVSDERELSPCLSVHEDLDHLRPKLEVLHSSEAKRSNIPEEMKHQYGCENLNR
jgi:hypothetical protein